MERPAAPVPPKPCRPILLEDPLFPRYKIRGVLAAGARRPLRFQSRRVGGRASTAEPQGSGPCLPNPIQLGCGRDLGFAGEGSGGKPSRRAAAHCGSSRCLQGELRIPEVGAACPGALPRWEMLLMLSSPPISGWRGRHRGTDAGHNSGSGLQTPCRCRCFLLWHGQHLRMVTNYV